MSVQELTTEQLNNIRYVAVRVKQKENEKEEFVGLFLGLKPIVSEVTAITSAQDNFIFLEKGQTVHILNVSRYNVHSIELGGPATSPVLFISCTADKQGEAHNLLRKIHDLYKSEKKVVDNNLINVREYYGVPEALKKEIEAESKMYGSSSVSCTSTTHSRSGGSVDYSTPGYVHRSACGHDYTTTKYKPKVVNTSLITRTTKYPIEAALERMQAKLKDLKDGKYKPPKLAVIPADKSAASAASDTQDPTVFNSDPEDNYSIYG